MPSTQLPAAFCSRLITLCTRPVRWSDLSYRVGEWGRQLLSGPPSVRQPALTTSGCGERTLDGLRFGFHVHHPPPTW